MCQPHESIATALHQVMFLPMLRSQSNDEQLEQFMPKASEFQMFGTYAQTEMGHGKLNLIGYYLYGILYGKWGEFRLKGIIP